MNDSTESEKEVIKKKRKGVLHTENYKVNRIKRARLAGEEYVNYSGNTVRSKKTREPCRCKMKCFDRINEEQREVILQKVYSFKTQNEQDIYLQSLIDNVPVQKRRPRNLGENRKKEMKSRLSSFRYNVFVETHKISVCKEAFKSLHDITSMKIKRLQNLLIQGKTPVDRRGKQNNRKTIPASTVGQIMNHIQSFPRKISHYSSTEVEYLSADLNIKIMYELFKKQYPSTAVQYSFYYKVFKERCNYRFGRPQVDTCCDCERLTLRLKDPSLNEVAKRVVAAELLVHKRRSNKFYKSIKETEKICKESRGLSLCLTFDYMQNISLPCVPVQEIYYYRQLSLFPFSIHNVGEGSAMFYLYHEGLAKKGPNEVCSFLLDYLNSYACPSVENLYLYSDNCAGQNKNHTMIRFLLALTDTGKYKKIIYRLPIRGHSFLPNDRDFGLVKRSLRRTDRYYTIEEVKQLILQSSKKNKFSLKLIDTTDIKDFQQWWPDIYKKTTNSIESQTGKQKVKETFKISEYCEFVFDSELKGMVTVSKYINGAIKSTFSLKRPGQYEIQLPSSRAYHSKCPILADKIEDLLKVVQYVPEEHKAFYNTFKNWPNRQKT